MTGVEDPGEQLRRVYERALAARDRQRYRWREHPIPWTAWRPSELAALAPDEFKDNVTIAAAVVRNDNGERAAVVAANNDGYMDPAIYAAAKAAGDFPIDPEGTDQLMDAEERVVTWADDRGYQVENIGASRPACNRCVRLIREHGARLSTPVSTQRRGPAAGGGYSPPSQGPKGGPKRGP